MINKNLIILLELFNNRPNHLAKFLMDNEAFSKKFLSKIENSQKFNNIKSKMHFNSIEEMDDYFNNLISDTKTSKLNKDLTDDELMDKLQKLIISENYEVAAKLRDYIHIRKRKNENKK